MSEVNVSSKKAPEVMSTQTIAFVGDNGAGKTTVSALVSDRLAERTRVTIDGDAGEFVETNTSRFSENSLGISWTVVDCPPGTEAMRARVKELDVVFIVATPSILETVSAYKRIADQHGLDTFLVVNRFTEGDRDLLRDADTPAIAEQIPEDPALARAVAAGLPPRLADRTVEAVLIEALQPDRDDAAAALDALAAGRRDIVNVEVPDLAAADRVVSLFESEGYRAGYFACNCRCHSGHVLALRGGKMSPQRRQRRRHPRRPAGFRDE